MLDRLFAALAPFSPTLVGTFPLGLHVDGSDLDVACSCDSLDAFERALAGLPIAPIEVVRVAAPPWPEAIVAALDWDGVPVELFGQALPVHAQAGFRHMIVEGRLLVAGGDPLRARVLAHKRAGVKTEPAFARVLGLAGDPYQTLLALEGWSGARLAGLVARALAADGPAIARFDGDRAQLLPLFRIADDSEVEIAGYLDQGVVLVATAAATEVGHVQLIDAGADGTWELKSVAVVTAQRGTGLGRRLVEAGLAHARSHGARRVVLSTGAADADLLRFYQRLGFRLFRVDRDVFTPAAGYPVGLAVDGVPLLDRVWLDREL